MDRNDEQAMAKAAAANGREGDAKRTWSKPTLHTLPLRDAMNGIVFSHYDGISFS